MGDFLNNVITVLKLTHDTRRATPGTKHLMLLPISLVISWRMLRALIDGEEGLQATTSVKISIGAFVESGTTATCTTLTAVKYTITPKLLA